jgi:putative lipoprotein (rSAM/lipoprotein system)
MKKLEFKMVRGYNQIIALVLSLLGFAGCEDLIGPEPKCEYGTPHADFVINGKIQSKLNNQAVPNIRVIVKDTTEGWNTPLDTAFSDGSGNYTINFSEFPIDKAYLLSVSDVDGASNGEYADKDTLVEFKNPQYIGGDGWYKGVATKTADIKIMPKQ